MALGGRDPEVAERLPLAAALHEPGHHGLVWGMPVDVAHGCHVGLHVGGMQSEDMPRTGMAGNRIVRGEAGVRTRPRPAVAMMTASDACESAGAGTRGTTPDERLRR